jgi:hypothetical protein
MTTGNQLHDLILAGVVLSILFWWIVRNADGLTLGNLIGGIVIVGLGLVYVALVFIFTIGLSAYENYKIKQCQTVHERIARARAAPSDYFGDKQRTDANAEQASCDELAARLAEREKTPDDFEPLRRMMRH